MILKKLGDEYKLYSHDSCIATTHESPYKKLSLKNCEAIANGYDLDELAREACNITDPLRLDSQKYKQDPYFRIGFIKGFQKALELLGDKKFSEEDMWNMFYFGDSLKNKIKSGKIENKHMGEIFDDYIKSLQQTEWDCTFNPDEKDSDGCLILKRK